MSVNENMIVKLNHVVRDLYYAHDRIGFVLAWLSEDKDVTNEVLHYLREARDMSFGAFDIAFNVLKDVLHKKDVNVKELLKRTLNAAKLAFEYLQNAEGMLNELKNKGKWEVWEKLTESDIDYAHRWLYNAIFILKNEILSKV